MSVNPFAAPYDARPASVRHLETADPFTRFGARMVDGIAAVATFAPSFALILALPVDPEGDLSLFWLELLPGTGLYIALSGYQWYGTATEGQTIGKRLLGIKVVTEDGRAPGFLVGVVVREWVLYFLAGLLNAVTGFVGSLLSLADALMVFGDQGRTLHDRLAGTRVVTESSALDLG